MRLVEGSKLTQSQRKEVLSAFIFRFTGEYTPYWAIEPLPSGVPHMPQYKTDDEWIRHYAFYIRKDGHLSKVPKHCEPVWMAKESNK